VLTLGELTPGTLFFDNLRTSAALLVLSVNKERDTVHILVTSRSSGRSMISRYTHDHGCSTHRGIVFLDHDGKDITLDIMMKH
jgi:hypothetical protein